MKFPSANGTFQYAIVKVLGNSSRFLPSRARGPSALRAGELHAPLTTKNLLTELQFTSHCNVAVVISFVQIIQQTAALADHLEQPAARAVVLIVLLQMLSEMIDPLGEQSNLNVGTTGISVMHPKLFNCFVLLFHTVRFQNKRIRASYAANSGM
jgi:hypothetical protein